MNKKHISLMLAALMCFTSIIPSFAYDLDEKGNSVEEVEYQNTEDEDYTNVTNVFAEIGSEYKVTIPKVIVLSGVTKKADYYVKVEGDIAGYETVNVVPDENVVLYTKNKASQTGTITQDKTSWKVSDFNVNANGEVSADGLTAGKWSGVFNFYINMGSHEEYVLGDIILPDFLDDDYRLRIKKISGNPGLYDEEANLIANINTLVDDYDFDVSKNDSSAGDIINTNYPNADMLVLPSGTYSIGNNAFSNANLSYIELPNSVTSIGSNVFNSNIKYINIPKSVSRIGINPAINKTAYYNNKPIKVITIDLENNDSVEIELEKGCRYEIEALYNFVNNVTNESTIISSDEKIVKFVPDCYLDAIEVGQCTISGTYTAKNGNQKYAEIKVNVVDNNNGNGSNTNNQTQTDTEKKLTVDTNGLAMDAGSSHEVHAYYDGKDVTSEIDWSSDNSKITVDNGLVRTLATAQVGDTATITASMSDDTSGLVATLDKMGIIAVASAEDGDDSVSFKVTIVEINFDDSEGNEIDEISILPGEHKSIKAKIVPETTGTVAWSCTAPSGVTLQKSGNNVIIYIADDMPEGRIYNVIATYGDYSKTIELTIASTAKDNLSISIEDGNNFTVGDVKDINVTTTDNTTPSNVTITSSDENVAKIIDGKIEAVGEGEATITISADGNVAKTINIIVEEAQMLEAGLYDANGRLIVTWDNMVKKTGFKIENSCNNKSNDSYYFSKKGFRYVLNTYSKNNITKVVIPNGVEKIGDYAFYNCMELETIEMPNSVTSIGEYAFANAYSTTKFPQLKTVKMSNSVNYIGQHAFEYCKSLNFIKIPSSIVEINGYTFHGCYALKSIKIPDSVTSIGSFAFGECQLESIKIPDSVTSIGDKAFYNCAFKTIGPKGSGFDVEIPSTLINFDIDDFKGPSIEKIIIPSTITSIKSDEFSSIDKIKSVGPIGSGCDVEIPDSVTSIGDNAFDRCASLESVEIPDSVTNIEHDAFFCCEALKSIKLPNSITTIESQTFYGCRALESIEIPSSVTEIKKNAFKECTALKFITLYPTLTTVNQQNYGNFRFDIIRDITFKGTIEQWNTFAKTVLGKNNDNPIPVHCTDGDTTY